MCDTILATPGSTAAQAMLFGKNSDRDCNEAQTVELHPRREHAPDAQVACTYLTIAQAPWTHAVLLCRPFWIWGAEMGANECGVVIGNEGIHARVPAPRENALTGMDLVRLALERAATAAEAVQLITTLLEQHGQGGNCGHRAAAHYNNGFMVADRAEAFVVETLGRDWLVERVRSIRAMSNAFSIGRTIEARSEGLAALIRNAGWSAEADPDYATVLADPHREHIGNAGARRACSTSLLAARDGELSVADMMSILRDHGPGRHHHPQWRSECAVQRTVCMHAGAELVTGQTVGSMVSELHRKDGMHWVTGTAAPCISIFKPVLLDAALPEHGAVPTGRCNLGTLWWQHEQLHRSALLGDFGGFLEGIRAERDELESQLIARMQQVLNGGNRVDRDRAVAQCWQEAMAMERSWYERIPDAPGTADACYEAAWNEFNELAAVCVNKPTHR